MKRFFIPLLLVILLMTTGIIYAAQDTERSESQIAGEINHGVDELVQMIRALRAERDAATHERDAAITQRDAAIAEKDRIASQNAQQLAALQSQVKEFGNQVQAATTELAQVKTANEAYGQQVEELQGLYNNAVELLRRVKQWMDERSQLYQDIQSFVKDAPEAAE